MPLVLDGELTLLNVFDGELDDILEFDGELGIVTEFSGHEEYHGETDITPSEEVQTLLTDSKLMGSNIIIEPIPTNYGRITWDGTKIIVS